MEHAHNDDYVDTVKNQAGKDLDIVIREGYGLNERFSATRLDTPRALQHKKADYVPGNKTRRFLRLS